MKLRVISRIFVLFAILAMVMTPTLSFAADSTMLSNPTVLNANLQKGSGGGIPVGTVITWPVGSNPEDAENWLECNGQAISQAVYPELFAVVGGNVPDYQGMFLRGYGSQTHAQNNGSLVGVTTTTHASGALGAVQGDAARRLTGSTNWVFGYQAGTNEFKSGMLYSHEDPAWDIFSVNWSNRSNKLTRFIFDSGQMVPVDGEERPANMAVRYLIRAVQ